MDINKEKAIGILFSVAEMYGKELSQGALNIFFMGIKSLSQEEFEEAVSRHLEDQEKGMFFPKPADLIGQVRRSGKQNSELVGQSAELGWSLVMDHLRKVGSYGDLNISDKVAVETVRQMGGWKSLCMTQTDKMSFKQKEFMSLYQTVIKTPQNLLPDELAGRITDSKRSSKVMGALRDNSAPMSVSQILIEKHKKGEL
jgi:hypothetical protein